MVVFTSMKSNEKRFPIFSSLIFVTNQRKKLHPLEVENKKSPLHRHVKNQTVGSFHDPFGSMVLVEDQRGHPGGEKMRVLFEMGVDNVCLK